MSTGVEPIRGVAGSTFTGPTAYDRLVAAEAYREGLTLTAHEVGDLIDQLPDEDKCYDDARARLAKVDVKTLRVSVKARQELAEALGFDAEDIWP
jgi:hypothetical protein